MSHNSHSVLFEQHPVREILRHYSVSITSFSTDIYVLCISRINGTVCLSGWMPRGKSFLNILVLFSIVPFLAGFCNILQKVFQTILLSLYHI